MRRALVAVALSALVAAAGCSIIFSVDRFEGDPPGAGDARTAEAGEDAPSDATITDALPPADAWCSHDAGIFCEDFDQSDGVSFPRWSFPPQRVNGTLSLDDAAVRSVPYALVVSTRANADATATDVDLYHRFPSTAGEVHVAFDIRVDALPVEYVHVLELKLRDATEVTRYEAFLLASSKGTLLYQSDSPLAQGPDASTTPLSPPLPLGTWTRVTLDLVYGQQLADAPLLRLRFDGSAPPVYEGPVLGGRKNDLFVLAGFGVMGSSPKGAVMLHFDNITIDPR